MTVALILVGLIAGVLSGMFGIGGGVVIVPALVLLIGIPLQAAVGTSLAALIMPVGLFAVLAYYRAGKLDPKVAALVAVGLVGGGFFGARLALSLPGETLENVYGLFLLYAAWRFIEPRKWLAEWRKQRPPATDTDAAPTVTASPFALILVGVVAGVVSGMFGIGGGLVIVPLLVALLRFDQKRAVGTSLGALLPPVSLPSVFAYYQANLLDVNAAILVAIGLLGGAFFGARLALGLPSAVVKRLYGIFLIFVGLRYLFF